MHNQMVSSQNFFFQLGGLSQTAPKLKKEFLYLILKDYKKTQAKKSFGKWEKATFLLDKSTTLLVFVSNISYAAHCHNKQVRRKGTIRQAILRAASS